MSVYDDLKAQVQKAQAAGQLDRTPSREEMADFAYGNTKLSNENVTREMVAKLGKITLDDLPALFEAARVEASSSARHTIENVPPDTCRYCGKSRRLFQRAYAKSVLDGHATCCVTLAFQKLVHDFWWTTPGTNKDKIAERLGVSYTTVASWLTNAEKKR